MEKFIKPRLLTPREQNHKKFWQAVGLCALTAAVFFLPFYILDGGFFHYAGDFNSQQISFYRYMNGFVKGAGYPDSAFAGAPRMHTGGWAGIKPDEVPAILQRGERVLSRREAAGYSQGQGAAPNVSVTIMARDAESFRQSRTQVAADIARAVSLGRRGM